MYYFCLVVWHCVLPDLSLCVFWDGPDSLASRHFAIWLINQLMSWPACPVTVHQCVPLTPVWLGCNQLKICKHRLCCDSALMVFLSVVPITTSSWMIPQNSTIGFGMNKVKNFSVASCSSLPLRPQGLNRLSFREKNQSKWDIKQKLLLTFTYISYFLHH